LHFFEKTLQKSDSFNDSPCLDRGYSAYLNTPTHGVLGLTATLDLYLPDNSSAVETQ
jgi:hypothetical protein